MSEDPDAEFVDDIRLLDELDKFNAKVSAAITYLEQRGHHPFFIKWALEQHLDRLTNGGRIPSLVGRQILRWDSTCPPGDELNEASRKRMRRVLAAAGATANEDADTLRKKLSDARRRSPAVRASIVGWPDAVRAALTGEPCDESVKLAVARLERLRRMGAIDDSYSLIEDDKASEFETDASESGSDS